ncbi:hypothetical protein [Rhodovulum euryhalinum]|uniref:Uncharacterized protein n=1 Tax=Rhodovulum euryhalinum TaxID=35805 RepID=A0A4R2KH37_9RHOB|nr:hypothetical protein [Rhodovulum euryhalinum]TCO69796.1 hypothetical protein EV655_11382 [Rhodovulum euryhalinum]
MADDNYDVLVPESAAKWFGILAGLLVPLFFGVVGAQLYGSSGGESSVQVYPLPEE